MINPKYFLNPPDILENSKELEDVLKSLNQEGTHLWKVRSASKWFRRKFSLDLNSMCMKYEPTTKSPCFSKGKQHSKSTFIHLHANITSFIFIVFLFHSPPCEYAQTFSRSFLGKETADSYTYSLAHSTAASCSSYNV
jgi:hypothetical protein